MVTSKEPDRRIAQFFVSNGPDARMAQSSLLVPKSQTQEWPRVHYGSKEPDTRMALFPMGQTHEWPKFILVPKSQTQEWPRVHFGSKEPDTRMALFPMGQTQEWPRFTLVPKSQTQEWLTYIYICIYIYIYSCLQAAHAGAHGQQRQVRFQYPTPGSSLATPWWRVEWPPAYTKFYIYSDGPHTHTHIYNIYI